MTTQTVSGRRYFTKAWLMEQKSLIALLVLKKKKKKSFRDFHLTPLAGA